MEKTQDAGYPSESNQKDTTGNIVLHLRKHQTLARGIIDADGLQEAAELAVRESRRPQAEVIVVEGVAE